MCNHPNGWYLRQLPFQKEALSCGLLRGYASVAPGYAQSGSLQYATMEIWITACISAKMGLLENCSRQLS